MVLSTVQGSSLEHNVEQTLPASSEVTLCVLSSRGEGVWLAGRAGDTRQPCPVLSHERCSTYDRASETASVSCRECFRVCDYNPRRACVRVINTLGAHARGLLCVSVCVSLLPL